MSTILSKNLIIHTHPRALTRRSDYDWKAWRDGNEADGPFAYGSTFAHAVIKLILWERKTWRAIWESITK